MTSGQKERPGGGTALLVLAATWQALGLTSFVNWRDVSANPPIHYTDYASHDSGAWATSRVNNGEVTDFEILQVYH